jgi:hypothetical protein
MMLALVLVVVMVHSIITAVLVVGNTQRTLLPSLPVHIEIDASIW